MVAKHLIENSFFLELKKRQGMKADAYCGLLPLAEPEAGEALEFIKAVFPSYTPHGMGHSMRILEQLYLAMNNALCSSLSSAELFCLIMATMFHDMGMASPVADNKEQQRKEHHLYAEEPLRRFIEENLRAVRERGRLLTCILFVCRAHGMELESFYGDQDFYKIDMIDGEVLRFGLLGVLLRIGDLLDLDENRSIDFIRRVYPSYFPQGSVYHHERHEQIKQYYISHDKIVVGVWAKNIEEFHIWEGWFHYLEWEILKANTYLHPKICNEFYFPALEYDIEKAAGSNFETEELRFELTDEGALWSILSQSVYTEEFDFIRELVQNGIDAVLMRYYVDTSVELATPSPRGWKIWDRQEKIIVSYSAEQRSLIISDFGTGMNLKEIKQFLFKIADSGYRQQATPRGFSFPAIAKFGIGFISCLSKCEEITIFTQPAKKEPGCMVRLFSNSTRAYFEELAFRPEHGTTICMILKRPYQRDEIRKYLQNMFRYTSVPVEFLDLDFMEKQTDLLLESGNLIKKPTYAHCYIMPHADFEASYQEVGLTRELLYQKSRGKTKVIQEKYDILQETVDNWINERRNFELSKKSFEKELAMLLRQIAGVDTESDIRKEISVIQQHCREWSEQDFVEHSYNLLNRLCDYQDGLQIVVDRLRNEERAFLPPRVVLGKDHLETFFDISTCAVQLTEHFGEKCIFIDPAKKGIHLKECGILFVQCNFEDMETGIEWCSIHGFLYRDGTLTKQLSSIDIDYRNDMRSDFEWISEWEEDYDIFEILEDHLGETGVNIGDGVTTRIRELTLSKEQFCQREEEVCEVCYDYGEWTRHSYMKKGATDFLNSLEHSLHMASDKDFPIHQIRYGQSALFQDGILIDGDPTQIVPLGMCKTRINLCAGARFDLNVTRRYADAAREKLDRWLATIGVIIQNQVIEQLLAAFDSCCLSWDVDALCFATGAANYFERQCAEQTKNLLQKFATVEKHASI